eukprot:TRINITY_DN4293_c0_g1_i1.p1 TRINITY_DN4293_c0_g1~~TRINITY_DN4293_c0_g1_i1.p1  ORF type:complete len:337 (+),score=18.22 TRINITY_DN4293_c0_g1_i1:969-1979(+)
MLKRVPFNQCNFYFTFSGRELVMMLSAFRLMIRASLPRLYEKMEDFRVTTTDFAETWFKTIFSSALTLKTSLRAFDHFLYGGKIMLYKIGISLLGESETLLMETTSKDHFLLQLKNSLASFPPERFPSLFQKTKLRTKTVLTCEMEVHNVMQSVSEIQATIFYRPMISTPSHIISEEDFDHLWSWLPIRYRIHAPVLYYSTANNGFSLNTLYRKTKDIAPMLLLLKTTTNHRFGAFLSQSWKQSEFFYGSGETFIFSLLPNPKVYKWDPTRRQNYFVMSTNESISVGGGQGVGIWLDDDLLNGRSCTCQTFQNEPLHPPSENFQCSSVEIYGLAIK